MQALEHERRLVARERETLARDARPSCRRASRSCATARRRSGKRLDERIEERLREARREIDAVVDRAEGADRGARRRGRARAPRGWSRPARPARRAPTRGRRSTRSASACAAARRPTAVPASGRATEPIAPPVVGDRVAGRARSASRAWSRRCTIATPRSTSGASGCGRGSTICACSRRPAAPPQRRRGSESTSTCSRATGSLTELNVIGCTVDEALARTREVPGRCADQRAAAACA